MNTLTARLTILIIALTCFGYANVASAANDENPDEAIIGVSVGPDGMLSGSVSMSTVTYTGLERADVGTLPTSPFYFLKQWGRGITRIFTFGSLPKAQLELDITNQIAAELLEIHNANPDDAKTLEKALANFTNAQERLNFRMSAVNKTPNGTDSEDLLRDVDAKAAKYATLLEQVAERWNTDPYAEDSARTGSTSDPDSDVLAKRLKRAQDNILRAFTITVTPVNDAPSLKQKAQEQIGLAGVAIEEAGDALMQVSTTRGMKIEDDESNIFDRWGNSIAKAMENLSEANKAFTEEKYGEAYGLARSAEAQVAHINVAVGDINGDGPEEIAVPNPSSAKPSTRAKVSEDISPLPQDRATVEQSESEPEEPKEIQRAESTKPEQVGAEGPATRTR